MLIILKVLSCRIKELYINSLNNYLLNAYHLLGTILVQNRHNPYSMELPETIGKSISISPQEPGSISYPIFPSSLNHFFFHGSFLIVQVQGTLNFKNVYILP